MRVIYRYPSMDLTDFNCNYFYKLLENISKEQKPIFLLGDFNVNLLNYNFSVDWEDLLIIHELNADNSTKMYLDKTNKLLDVPLKRINEYKQKFKSKPWITLDLQKSISVKK